MRILLRSSLTAALVALMAAPAGAQLLEQTDIDHTAAEHRSEPVACGMHIVDAHDHEAALARTAKLDPALYSRMVARVESSKGERRGLQSADLGLEDLFFVYNNATGVYEQVTAVLAYDGILARVWIDVRDTARVKPDGSQISTIARALDTATVPTSHDPSKGILALDIELFGAPPTTHQIDGKTDFLLTDIKEAIQGGFIAGYFSQQDQMEVPGSNLRNILYIDSREGLQSTKSLLNTIAHEYQHLIHYARRRNGELFFNEGCSEVASILTGYWNRSNTGYMANTNVDLLTWPSGSTDGSLLLATYERAMTLTHFLYEQFGTEYLYEFVGATGRGIARVDEALTKAGLYSEDVNAKTALRYFAVANYLQSNADVRYGYQLKVGTRKPTLGASYVGATLPESGTVNIKRYATSYLQIADAEARTVRFTGSGDFRVMAMITTDGVLEVRELAPSTSYRIGGSGSGDKVVLAFVNLANTAYDIKWTATADETSGVEDEAGAATGLAISAIAPNPVSSRAVVTYRSASSAPVTLELIDARGRSVRTYLDGASVGAGAHDLAIDVDGLPAGYYMAALTQDGRRTTHVVVIAR